MHPFESIPFAIRFFDKATKFRDMSCT